MKTRLKLWNNFKMDDQEGTKHRSFRIDWQGYNTDDLKKREERIDVSPSGTEGIFIDTESPECDGEE